VISARPLAAPAVVFGRTGRGTSFGRAVWLWKISLPTHLDFAGRKFTVTAYDGAGHVIQTVTLGTIG